MSTPGTALQNLIESRRNEARQLKEMAFIPDSKHPVTDAMNFTIDISSLLGDMPVLLTLRRDNLLSDNVDAILLTAFEMNKVLIELDGLQEKGVALKAPFKTNQFVLNADASLNSKGQVLVLQWL